MGVRLCKHNDALPLGRTIFYGDLTLSNFPFLGEASTRGPQRNNTVGKSDILCFVSRFESERPCSYRNWAMVLNRAQNNYSFLLDLSKRRCKTVKSGGWAKRWLNLRPHSFACQWKAAGGGIRDPRVIRKNDHHYSLLDSVQKLCIFEASPEALYFCFIWHNAFDERLIFLVEIEMPVSILSIFRFVWLRSRNICTTIRIHDTIKKRKFLDGTQ